MTVIQFTPTELEKYSENLITKTIEKVMATHITCKSKAEIIRRTGLGRCKIDTMIENGQIEVINGLYKIKIN